MSKSRPTQNTTVQTVAPWIEEASRANIDNANNLPMFQPYTGERVAPLSQGQMDARDVVYRNYRDVRDTARSALPELNSASQYQPMMLSDPRLGGSNVNARDVMASDIDIPPDVIARMIQAEDVIGDTQAYMNPFLSSVVDSTIGTLDRARMQTQQGNSAAAAKAGAFGGSRHGVVEGETNRGFADAAATATGNLNMAGYTQALQAALQGATSNQATALTADRSNQDSAIRVGTANQDANLRAGISNQNADIQTGQINSQRDLATMDATLRAQLGNQSASSDAARTRLQGALGINSVADTVMRGNAQDQQGLLAVGALEQGNEQAGLEAAFQEFMRQQQDPYQRLNAQISATGGARGTQSNTTNGQQHTNLLGPILGLGLSAATGGTGGGLMGLLGLGTLGAGEYGGGIGGSTYSVGFGGQNVPVFA